MDRDSGDVGDIAEGASGCEKAQVVASPSRRPQRPVLEVWRVARPLAQPLLELGGPVARGVVLVCEGEQIGGDGALVCLVEARQGEGAGLEETRRGVRHGRRLVRVEGAAVVLGRAKLVPGGRQRRARRGAIEMPHLLGGSSFFLRRLSLLRATGSNALRSSGDGGGTENDEGSTSPRAAVEAWRHNDGRRTAIAGRTSLHRADTARCGSSRRAMCAVGGGRRRLSLAWCSLHSRPRWWIAKSLAVARAPGDRQDPGCTGRRPHLSASPSRPHGSRGRRRPVALTALCALSCAFRYRRCLPVAFVNKCVPPLHDASFAAAPSPAPPQHPHKSPHRLAEPSPGDVYHRSSPLHGASAPHATMNGVTRFLSRREKHHEKRASKTSRSTVRSPSPASPYSSDPLLCSVDGTSQQYCACHRPRRPSCVRCLYRILSSSVRGLVDDGLLFLDKKHARPDISQSSLHPSPALSSNNLTSQSRQPPSTVPSELYKVFTNEDQKPADKDGEKKVRPATSYGCHACADGCRSNRWSSGCKQPASPL